jgi:hypothetical protein
MKSESKSAEPSGKPKKGSSKPKESRPRLPGQPKLSTEERKQRDSLRQSEKRRRLKEKKTGKQSEGDSAGQARSTKLQTPKHVEVQQILPEQITQTWQVKCLGCGATLAVEGRENLEAVIGAHKDHSIED